MFFKLCTCIHVQVLHSLSMLAAGATSITKESLGGGEGKTSIRKVQCLFSSCTLIRITTEPL